MERSDWSHQFLVIRYNLVIQSRPNPSFMRRGGCRQTSEEAIARTITDRFILYVALPSLTCYYHTEILLTEWQVRTLLRKLVTVTRTVQRLLCAALPILCKCRIYVCTTSYSFSSFSLRTKSDHLHEVSP